MNTSNHSDAAHRIESTGPEETFRIGRMLGANLFPGAVVGLRGELGCGKTLLVKGIAAGLSVADPAAVVSPTFAILNVYAGAVPLYHFDAYRLTAADAFRDLGAEEYLEGKGVCVVEWSDKVAAALPPERLEIAFAHLTSETRRLDFFPRAPHYATAVTAALGR